MRTPEGKAYDEKLGKDFMEKHLATMRQCKPSDGKGLESFWMLMKLDKDGAVKEALLHPETKMGDVRAGDAAQERVLAAAAARVLGERVHEVGSLYQGVLAGEGGAGSCQRCRRNWPLGHSLNETMPDGEALFD